MQRALEAMWERLYAVIDGTRFERTSDLIVALCPRFPVPQCNGAWVVEDSQAAAEALPEVIAEVEAAEPGRGCRHGRGTSAHSGRRSSSGSRTPSAFPG
jgi:hypothetical protein